MNEYVVLLRGINVGGRNKVPMAQLRSCMEDLGFEQVRTYIASGNVLLRTAAGARAVRETIEDALPRCFSLDVDLVRALVLTPARLQAIVDARPEGFGDDPDTYCSDVVFLIGITAAQAMPAFDPREGVDTVWPGQGVVYAQRLAAQRTRSRLGKIAGTAQYRSMTIRSWNTVTKLLQLARG